MTIIYSHSLREEAYKQALKMPVQSLDLRYMKREPMMLAPPPVHLSGPIPNDGHPEITSVEVDGKKFFILSIKGHIAITEAKEKYSQRGNGKPKEPIIIEKPGGKFFVKFPGKNWVDIQTMEADDPLLAELLRAAGNIIPPIPPDKGGNGDGSNGNNGELAPFKFGDLVTSKSHPEFGVLFVTECKKYRNEDGSEYWRVMTVYKVNPMGSYSEYSAAASDFVFYAKSQ